MCRHRLDLAYVIATNGYIGFVQFFDFQIVLHFLYLIEHKRVPTGERVKYIILTKDKSFLHSAKNEWQKKSKSNTRPKLEFGKNFIKSGNITIWVEEIGTRPNDDDKRAIRRQLVHRFSKRSEKVP